MFNNYTTVLLHIIVSVSLLFLLVTSIKRFDVVKIAFLSIIRRWQLSLVLSLTVFVCTLALMVMGGYFFHSFWGLSESTIRSETGHFQIFAKGFEANKVKEPWGYKLSNLAIFGQMVAGDELLSKKISILAPELNFTGVLSNGDHSTTFIARAVVPEADRKLSAFGEVMDSGIRFVSGDKGVALLGKGMAQALDAKNGDWLSLLTNSPDAGMTSLDLEVKGITESFSKDYDDVALKIPIESAWEMFGDTIVDKIIVLLEKTSDLDTVFSHFRKKAEQEGLSLEYKTWDELAVYYQSVKRLYTSIFRFFSAVIMIFSVIFITSILLIMIMQRTYEIALLRSFGSKKWAILRNFLIESILLGYSSAILSVIISIGLISIFNIFGIETAPPPGSSRGYVIKLMVLEQPFFIIQVFEFIVSTMIMSSIYPAVRGCRLQIVQSLRRG